MGLLHANDEESMFWQTAVYWAPVSPDADGQPQWAAPVTIACRWGASARNRLGPKDEVGDVMTKVYVAQDVATHGMLLLGELTSSMGTDARSFGAREIMSFSKNPTREGGDFLRTASLAGG